MLLADKNMECSYADWQERPDVWLISIFQNLHFGLHSIKAELLIAGRYEEAHEHGTGGLATADFC